MNRDEQRAAVAAMWGLADYSGLAERLLPAAVALVDAVSPLAGYRVLDVAAGTGNVAVLATERGAQATAADIAPRMVQLGRERTGSVVQWIEADVEDLPLPDASVDIALSAFGLIFAPRPAVALAQLRRVLTPGGQLAFTAWTVDGYTAQMTRIITDFLPPNPSGPDARSWGDPDVLATRLADGFTDVRIERRSLPWHFDSGAQYTAFLAEHSPVHVAVAQQVGDRADELRAAIERHAAPDGGPVRIDAEYLLVHALARE